MIVFENKGNIDLRAIKTFGVNAKLDEKSAIGYFGTGLKYAIAILIRNDIKINILSGGKNYEFSSAITEIRDTNFDIITMNGEELGYTTDLGKNWELWMAFRELMSNAMDENGDVYSCSVIKDIKSASTYVCVEGAAFDRVFADRDKYFLCKERRTVAAKHRDVDAYEKACPGSMVDVFYRGILAMQAKFQSLYDYNHHNGLTLTEDRTISDAWAAQYHLAALVTRSNNKKFITRMVMADPSYYEARINYAFGRGTDGEMEVFLDTVGELRKKYKDADVNQSAIVLHKQVRKVKDVMPGISCHLNAIEQKQLDKAVEFCKTALSLELDDYKLIVVKDLGDDTRLGRANVSKGIMYISKQCFREGTKRVAVAILEEYTHCKHRVADETVEQKWVYLNQIISLGELLKGDPL